MSLAFARKLKEDPTLKAKEFCQIDASGEGAKQEFKDDSDINFLLRNLKMEGVLDRVDVSRWQAGSLEQLTLQEALNIQIEATDLFEQLPSKVRKEFDNNPIKFVQGVESGKYKDLLDENGLLKVKEMETIMKVEVTNQPNNDDQNDDKK